jgi:hypothetical protein
MPKLGALPLHLVQKPKWESVSENPGLSCLQEYLSKNGTRFMILSYLQMAVNEIDR